MKNVVNVSSANLEVPELICKIVKWHYDRNLVHGSDNKNQTLKLVQEFGELGLNLLNRNYIGDDVGDMVVVLINLMEREGFNFKRCIENSVDRSLEKGPNFLRTNKKLPETIENYLKFYTNMNLLSEEHIITLCERLIYSMGQLSDAVCRGKDLSIHIGFILRDLFALAESHNLTIESCLEQAWNDIKDRKGMMVDGVFVKEADLN